MSTKIRIFTKKIIIMFKLIKYAAIFYTFTTITMFLSYGFWWSMSVLWMSAMVTFFTVVGQLPIIRVYYFYIVCTLYLIIFTTSNHWGIQDPEAYRIMQFIYIPMGFVLYADILVDTIKSITKELF